ncbi:hypothetical protein H2198_005551 [Neophaeococcomyces mojaviensis]|uniref:Uncharacterized protein n=1 Tax=Neophaeococcomyces mojaviensis TaxID=3383035 RepID=A0ACC3A5N3_9EURO|nr:hypothetical protein H2198_005551 [Knufia sp. JES_112]
MPVMPEPEQFAHVTHIAAALKNTNPTCAWYLPKMDRCCLNHVDAGDLEDANSLIHDLSQVRDQDVPLTPLKRFAVLTCCRRAKHRYLVLDSGLADRLAEKWQRDLRESPLPLELGVLPEDTSLELPKSEDVVPDTSQTARYQTRSTNSGLLLSLFNDDDETANANTEFGPHICEPGETLSTALCSTIPSKKCKKGHIYLFSRLSSPGFVKIGYTGKTVSQRLAEWEECGYVPQLERSFSNVPHPERVETLVHFELVNFWHREKWCKAHTRSHIEWFKLDVSKATEVANNWVRWMTEAKPYDDHGQLTWKWYNTIKELISANSAVTARKLLDVHDAESHAVPTDEKVNASQIKSESKPVALSQLDHVYEPETSSDIDTTVADTKSLLLEQASTNVQDEPSISVSPTGIFSDPPEEDVLALRHENTSDADLPSAKEMQHICSISDSRCVSTIRPIKVEVKPKAIEGHQVEARYEAEELSRSVQPIEEPSLVNTDTAASSHRAAEPIIEDKATAEPEGQVPSVVAQAAEVILGLKEEEKEHLILELTRRNLKTGITTRRRACTFPSVIASLRTHGTGMAVAVEV